MKKQHVLIGTDKMVGRPIRLNQQTLLPKEGKEYAELMFIGDVHLGSPQYDMKRFRAMIDYCLQKKLYVLLMGDLIEMATRDSVGAGVYEQDSIGQCQYERMLEILQPLADAKLILGTHRGNHEERVYRATGVDIAKSFARELKVKYLADACWNAFKVGKQVYTIYSLHGRTGSRFDGTALLAVERISTSFFADIVAMGHTHKCVNSIVLMQKVKNGIVSEHKKHLVLTGGYLKYDGGYGQTVGLPISKLGSPKVKLFSTRHDINTSW